MNDTGIQLANHVFEGNRIAVIWYRGKPHWIMGHAALAMGYADANALITLVKRNWKDEFIEGHHFVILRGGELSKFKKFIATHRLESISPNTPSLALLTEDGLWLAIEKSETAAGKRYRRFVSEEVMPQVVRDGSYSPDRQVEDGKIIGKGTPAHGIPVQEAAPFSERLRGLEAIDRIVHTVSPRNRSQFVMKAIAGLFPSGRPGRRSAVTALVHADAPAALLEPPGPGWKAASLLIEEHGCSRKAFAAIVKDLGLKGNPNMAYVAYGPTRYDARTLVPHTWYSPAAQQLITEEVAIAEGVRAARKTASKVKAKSNQESLPLDDCDEEDIH
jgi:prophage antirepressor-like protein